MARIKLPSYIKEGHGRMEDAVIITRGDTSFMKIYKKYDRGSTENQLQIRNAFKTIVSDWKYLNGIIVQSWDLSTADKNASGYNAFVGANVLLRRAGKPLTLCTGLGEDVLMNFTAAPGAAAGEITCSFLPAEAGHHVTFFMRRVTEPGVNAPFTRHDAGADPVSPVTIAGFESGVQYHVYAVVTDAQYDSALTVSPSVAALASAG